MAVEIGNCKETMTEEDLRRLASLLPKVAWFESLREQGVNLAPFKELIIDLNPKENKFWELMQTLPEGDYGHQGHIAENYANQVRMFVGDYGPPGWNPSTCKVNWKEFACFCNGGARLHLDLIAAGVPIPEKEKILNAYFAQFDGTKEVMPFNCNQATLSDPLYDELNAGIEKEDEKVSNRGTYIVLASAMCLVVAGIAVYSFWPKDNEMEAERQYRLARGY